MNKVVKRVCNSEEFCPCKKPEFKPSALITWMCCGVIVTLIGLSSIAWVMKL